MVAGCSAVVPQRNFASSLTVSWSQISNKGNTKPMTERRLDAFEDPGLLP